MSPALVPIVAVAVFLADWFAVATSRRRLELVAKPAASLVLVSLALVVGDAAGDVRAAVVVAAVLGLIGDVALLGDGDGSFLAGLSAFAVGHVAYAVGALIVGLEPVPALVGAAVVAALLGFRFVQRIVPGARQQGGAVLGAAVVGYAVVISSMVVTAWGTATWMAAVGATSFAASDWLIGHGRFVGPTPGGRVAVMVTYHVGQVLLIAGLLRA